MTDQNQPPADPNIPRMSEVNDQIPPKTSGLAIASLILGILGFVTCGLTAFLGLLLGAIALYRIRGSRSVHKGRSLAIAGIATSTVVLAFIVSFFCAYESKSAEIYHKRGCFYKAQVIALSMSMYMNENDDHLPASDRWVSSVSPYMKTYRDSGPPFICPSVGGKRPCYAMNQALDGIDVNDVADTSKVVMVFESVPGDNPVGGKELLPKPPRHGSSARNQTGGINEFRVFRYIKDQYIIAFLDGHVKKPTVGMVDLCIWNPMKSEK